MAVVVPQGGKDRAAFEFLQCVVSAADQAFRGTRLGWKRDPPNDLLDVRLASDRIEYKSLTYQFKFAVVSHPLTQRQERCNLVIHGRSRPTESHR
jgi:hypothetical protein